jgi:hypothetical protein
MRGDDLHQDGMFSYISPEQRVPKDHTLRPIRKMVDEILVDLSPRFKKLYSNTGRPSIAPEKLLERCCFRCCTACEASGCWCRERCLRTRQEAGRRIENESNKHNISSNTSNEFPSKAQKLPIKGRKATYTRFFNSLLGFSRRSFISKQRDTVSLPRFRIATHHSERPRSTCDWQQLPIRLLELCVRNYKLRFLSSTFFCRVVFSAVADPRAACVAQPQTDHAIIPDDNSAGHRLV